MDNPQTMVIYSKKSTRKFQPGGVEKLIFKSLKQVDMDDVVFALGKDVLV